MVDAVLRQFRWLARYNTRANGRLYDACARLSDEARKEDRRGFFGSIHGTLNHIMVGDRVWLARLEGGDAPSTNLDAILFEDFGDLRAARAAEDARIEAMAERLTVSDLDRRLDYTNNEGRQFSDPVSLILPHLFNHQTHHRGQVHDMLSQAGAETPVLDMHRVLRPDPDAPIGGDGPTP